MRQIFFEPAQVAVHLLHGIVDPPDLLRPQKTADRLGRRFFRVRLVVDDIDGKKRKHFRVLLREFLHARFEIGGIDGEKIPVEAPDFDIDVDIRHVGVAPVAVAATGQKTAYCRQQESCDDI